MRIYDDQGALADTEVKEFIADLAAQVGELTARLFSEGMTVLEARALAGYLRSSVEFAIVMQILAQRLPNKE